MNHKLIVSSEGQGIWCEHFLRHLNPEIVFEKSARSNLIIRSLFLNQEGEHPYRLPYICWSGEPLSTPERNYPPLFTIWSIDKPIVPFIIIIYFDYSATCKINLNDLSLYPNKPRPYFLAYCASSAIYERETLFKLLRDRNSTAHGLGRCQTTPGFHDKKTFHNLRHTYSDYRFALAMENSVIPGYVTEKLLNVMLAGCIPIYYGDDKWVKRFFNEKAIIFVQDFPSLEACADYIVQVDTNPLLYNQYKSEKHFVKEQGWFGIGEPPKEYVDMRNYLIYQ